MNEAQVSNRLMDQADVFVVKQDYESAATLLKKAAKMGNLAAYHNLSQLYIEKKCRCENSTEIAIEILTYCANAGFSISQKTLGRIFLEGRHVKRDLDVARKWFQKMSEQGFYDSGVETSYWRKPH